MLIAVAHATVPTSTVVAKGGEWSLAIRTLDIELLGAFIAAGLLLEEVGFRGPCGFILEGEMHPLVSAVLLRFARLDAFNSDPKSEPPERIEPGSRFLVIFPPS